MEKQNQTETIYLSFNIADFTGTAPNLYFVNLVDPRMHIPHGSYFKIKEVLLATGGATTPPAFVTIDLLCAEVKPKFSPIVTNTGDDLADPSPLGGNNEYTHLHSITFNIQDNAFRFKPEVSTSIELANQKYWIATPISSNGLHFALQIFCPDSSKIDTSGFLYLTLEFSK